MARNIENRHIVRALAVFLTFLLLPGFAMGIEVGEEAPDFALTDMEGHDHSLSGYSSQPVLLMFLSCGEGSSRAIAPLVQDDIYSVYSSQGLNVLGIDCQSSTMEQITHFRNETNVRFPLLMDGEVVQTAYDVPVSSFVLVDGGGTVRYVSCGPGGQAYDRQGLTSTVELILREVNSSKIATWGTIKGLYSD